MREAENIRDIEQCGTDLMGFIFYERSPRYVDKKVGYLPKDCKRVGVFVNESSEKIVLRAAEFGLDYIQLHGNESPEQCQNLTSLGLKVIKAFSVSSVDDINKASLYQGFCEHFLFDTACSGYGGSGKSFNWDILSNYTLETPFLLSGGISSDSVDALKSFQHPKLLGIDINSCFEISPAMKDAAKVAEFIKQIKK